MRLRPIKSLIIILANCFLFCVCTWAQTDFGIEEGFEDPYFYIDCAGFREDKGEKYAVEIYHKIFNPKLTFVKEREGFTASYELNLTILRKGGKHAAAKSIGDKYTVSSYHNSVSPDEYLIGISAFSLYSGEYILVAELIDRNSKRKTTLKRGFSLPSRLKKDPGISDIQLCHSAKDATSSKDFVKLGKELIPNVSGIFGERDSVMFAYFEVYPDARKTKQYILTYRISGKKATVLDEEDSVQITESKSAQIRRLGMQELSAGDYVLNIELYSNERQLLARSDRRLRIDWSALSLLKKDYDKGIHQLKYIAEEDEMKELEDVEVSDRERAWEDFWKSKDPTPNTDKNEMKDEYYKRLNYANANFGVYNKEGWETDMGMVLVIYGYPDEIERHYFDRESDRVEGEYAIWYYYRLRPERRFFFKDSGYGEYQLQFPYDGIQR